MGLSFQGFWVKAEKLSSNKTANSRVKIPCTGRMCRAQREAAKSPPLVEGVLQPKCDSRHNYNLKYIYVYRGELQQTCMGSAG